MKTLTILFLLMNPFILQAQSIVGTWQGVLDVQGTSLRIVFHIEEADGTFTTKMDSPDQGATNIATSETTFADNQLTIKAAQLGMIYEGNLENDSTVAGTFTQGGMAMPLTLKRGGSKEEAVVRPQDPTGFPYRQEEIYFTNAEGHKLAGTLTIPKGKSFDKAVVLISGSGPQNRNEELGPMNHRPFLVLSDYFTRRGIAVLRYDDRGVAESEGDFASATSADFAEDVQAAVAFLQQHPATTGKSIGLVGHSEGGMIAPMVVSENEGVGFIVLLAGPGIPIIELLKLQSEHASRAAGATSEAQEANAKALGAAHEYLLANATTNRNSLRDGLTAVLEEYWTVMPEETKQSISDKSAFFERQVKTLTSDWFRYFLAFDPSEYLQQVRCPVLAINGALDVQVTADENLAGIEAALRKGGNQNVTIQKIENQNHLFQTATTGAVAEYGKIEETFNENTMNLIIDWIQAL
ncbi:alpha/beta hydrolase family protein [Tunicatimonas pelagia]|uniref:alpha/beta hydrolase family protein n=1 Tax=Tunicatimonas pelagia TaxID=931531 RepID=UPI0026658AD7|nr:alpha/beta hydrolase [Tunicatimonas pelagia]WKN41779.1 alpha/beta hydrolase [Tunicatimonas pelagia]